MLLTTVPSQSTSAPEMIGPRRRPASDTNPRSQAGFAWRRTFSVPSDNASVRTARHAVSDAIRLWGADPESDLLDTVELITTELVTNSVRHAGRTTPRIEVTVQCDAEGAVEIGVRDNEPTWLSVHTAGEEFTCGRGLAIIEALAAETGGDVLVVHHGNTGKTVWVHLPAPPQPTAANR